MPKIKKFYIDEDSEVTAISLVETPAIMSDFIALAKQAPKQVCLEKEDRHLVLGAILIPERPIYRYDEDMGEYYITFTKEVISKLAYQYMRNKLTDAVTLDHKTDANNITLVESWVRETENDKSVAYGLDAPIGSWIGMMKVNDEETWERIKSGELNGFSVEAFCNLNEIKFNKHNMVIEDSKSFLEEVKAMIMDAFAFNLAKDKEEDEDKEDDEKDAPTTSEETVEEPIETPADETSEPETEEDEEKKKEEKAEEIEPVETPTEEIVEEVVAIVEETSVEPEADLQAIVDELQAKVDELTAENEELKKQNQKLSKQPSVKQVDVKASSEKKYPSFLDFASGNVRY